MIEGAFGPVTERLQSGVSAQEVVLVLHSVRRKHSLLLLEVKVRNKNWLQSVLHSHCFWHSIKSKAAPTIFERGSREQRSPLWPCHAVGLYLLW